jgi:hypothetical protein
VVACLDGLSWARTPSWSSDGAPSVANVTREGGCVWQDPQVIEAGSVLVFHHGVGDGLGTRRVDEGLVVDQEPVRGRCRLQR